MSEPTISQAPLSAWTDGTETYVAESIDAALEMQRTHGGYAAEEQEPAADWRAHAPEKVLAIDLDDGRGKVRQTVAEWIAETGPGPLCSTEW